MGVVLSAGARRARRLLLLAGLVFAAFPAGSALADVTIGQTGGNHYCYGDGATFVDRNYVSQLLVSKITSFSFQSTSANKGQQLEFLVLRPIGGDHYLLVGKTGVVTLKGTGLETFPANIHPVWRGDMLGLRVPRTGNSPPTLDNCARFANGGGARYWQTITDPNVGDTISIPGNPEIPFDLNESAIAGAFLGAPRSPTSKKQCKHGGWTKFGSRFKNQRQCVSFVEHQHHKHHPGIDLIVGGRGNDIIRGGAGNDRIYGGPGNDRIYGGPGNDRIYGGPGNDRIYGGPGNDRIYGGPGNDTIHARDGHRDVVDCGRGRDVAFVDPVDVVRGCERVESKVGYSQGFPIENHSSHQIKLINITGDGNFEGRPADGTVLKPSESTRVEVQFRAFSNQEDYAHFQILGADGKAIGTFDANMRVTFADTPQAYCATTVGSCTPPAQCNPCGPDDFIWNDEQRTIVLQ